MNSPAEFAHTLLLAGILTMLYMIRGTLIDILIQLKRNTKID